jgi:hypothetical protein
MLEKNLVFAHEPDAAWIIALWLHIYGGDPSIDQVAASAIAALAPYLKTSAETFTGKQVAAGFEALGVKVTQPVVEDLVEPGQFPPPRQYCFKFQGKTICITLPSVRAVFEA